MLPTDACLVCAKPDWPDLYNYDMYHIRNQLNPRGQILGTPFHICSTVCYEKLLHKHYPWASRENLELYKQPLPQLLNDIQEEYVQKEFDQEQREQDRLRKETDREADRLKKEHEDRYNQLYEQAELDHKLFLYNELHTPLPFFFPSDIDRHAGTWIVGYSGSGKSTLEHLLVLNDIFSQQSPGCGILIMDNKLDLVKPFKTYAAIQDRLILIEPRADLFLALNPLNIPGAEKIHTLELIEHLLADQLNSAMSGLQSSLFRHVVPALYDINPHPTFSDLFEIMKHGLTPAQLELLYDKNLEQNDFGPYTFFTDKKHGFDSMGYASTRDATVRKLDQLYTVSPILKNMFNAPETKLDLGKLFDEGKIICIDADQKLLGKEGSHFFLRFMLAYIYIVAQQRSGREQHQKNSVFVYCDECHWIANDINVASVQDRCRSQKIGFIWAHQRLENIKNPDVLSALTNCPVKYCNVDADATKMSEYLHTKPELASPTPKKEFTAYYRGHMKHGQVLDVPFIDWSDTRQFPRVEPSEPRKRALQYCYVPAKVTPPPRPHNDGLQTDWEVRNGRSISVSKKQQPQPSPPQTHPDREPPSDPSASAHWKRQKK
jgi:hypothetical protein